MEMVKYNRNWCNSNFDAGGGAEIGFQRTVAFILQIFMCLFSTKNSGGSITRILLLWENRSLYQVWMKCELPPAWRNMKSLVWVVCGKQYSKTCHERPLFLARKANCFDKNGKPTVLTKKLLFVILILDFFKYQFCLWFLF